MSLARKLKQRRAQIASFNRRVFRLGRNLTLAGLVATVHRDGFETGFRDGHEQGVEDAEKALQELNAEEHSVATTA